MCARWTPPSRCSRNYSTKIYIHLRTVPKRRGYLRALNAPLHTGLVPGPVSAVWTAGQTDMAFGVGGDTRARVVVAAFVDADGHTPNFARVVVGSATHGRYRIEPNEMR